MSRMLLDWRMENCLEEFSLATLSGYPCACRRIQNDAWRYITSWNDPGRFREPFAVQKRRSRGGPCANARAVWLAASA